MASFCYACLMLAAQVRPGGGSAEAAPAANPADGSGGGGLFEGMGFFLPAMLIVMVLYFMLMLPRQQQKDQAKINELLDNLKKNDEVVTAGGIRGTVVNIREDGEFVTIRIDENTNTKMKILKKSVVRVLTDENKKDV